MKIRVPEGCIGSNLFQSQWGGAPSTMVLLRTYATLNVSTGTVNAALLNYTCKQHVTTMAPKGSASIAELPTALYTLRLYQRKNGKGVDQLYLTIKSSDGSAGKSWLCAESSQRVAQILEKFPEVLI